MVEQSSNNRGGWAQQTKERVAAQQTNKQGTIKKQGEGERQAPELGQACWHQVVSASVGIDLGKPGERGSGRLCWVCILALSLAGQIASWQLSSSVRVAKELIVAGHLRLL